MSNEIQSFMQPANLDEAMRAAEIMADSNMVPAAFQGKPGDILIAGQMSAELGVSWMQGLQNIAVINGRPTIWGDLALALICAHRDYEYHTETYDEETRTATCIVKRKSAPEPVTQTFSWADACAAGLHEKDTYKKYRRRMLQMRARSWAIRDCMPDALRGLSMAEEMLDVTPISEQDVKPIVTGTGTNKLKDALSKQAALAEPAEIAETIDDEQPKGSAEWWAEKINNAETPAVLEKIGYELKATDPDVANSLRELYMKAAGELKKKAVENAPPSPEYQPIEGELVQGPDIEVTATRSHSEPEIVHAEPPVAPNFFGG